MVPGLFAALTGRLYNGSCNQSVVRQAIAFTFDLREVNMHIELSADQQAFIDGLVTDQHFATADDAVGEAIRLLEDRVRLKRQIDVGLKQSADGDVVDHDTVFAHLRNIAHSALTDSASAPSNAARIESADSTPTERRMDPPVRPSELSWASSSWRWLVDCG